MRRHRDSLLVSLAFLVGRLAWSRAGIPFRADTIDYFAQLLDPPLLRDHLAQSLWYLHAQPPLFNAIAGLALKVAPEDPGRPLSVLYLVAGLATCLGLFLALRSFRWPAGAAGVVALVATSTPTVVVYEHWFFYPHLAAALLAVAAALLARSRGEPGADLAGGFVALGALGLLRSLFHPLYFAAAVAAAVAFAPRGRRRRAFACAAIPVAPVFLLAAKNLVLFGFFGTSSWGGNSAHRMLTESVPPPQVESLIASGELSPISREWEFSPPEKYVALLGPARGNTGIPALDQTGKTRTRENPVNYNHWIYPIASAVYLKDTKTLLRAHPGAFARSVRWTSRRFLDPVTDDSFVRPIRFRVRRWIAPFEAMQRSWLLRSLVLGAIAALLVRIVRGRVVREERLVTVFLLGTILWVSATGILLEYGENNRFRYQLGPPLLLVVSLAGRDLLASLRGRRRSPDHAAPPAG
ncbi:MAG: hypothetical protein R3B81_15855 [bacterium]